MEGFLKAMYIDKIFCQISTLQTFHPWTGPEFCRSNGDIRFLEYKKHPVK